MKDNNELKERINRELEKPDVPFDEWAKARGVFDELDEKSEVTCPVYEFADNVKGRGISGANKKRCIIGVSIFVFILIVIAVILGTVLVRNNKPDGLPKIYGANDATSVKIELEELTANADIYIFDTSAVIQNSGVTKDVLIHDTAFILLYSINNCLIYIKNGEDFDAFYLTYQIRTYQYYEFYNLKNYLELNKTANFNNFEIGYKLVESDETYAYAKFNDGKYEYFIEAHGFNGLTILTEENFLNLLNKILI